MRFRSCVLAVGGLLTLTSAAIAQQGRGYGSPGLLAVPESSPSYVNPWRGQAYPTSAQIEEPSPADMVPPIPEAPVDTGSMYDEALSNDDYSGCGDCCTPCTPRWYVAAGGLYMNRDGSNDFWTTYENNVPFNQMMHSPDTDWNGGFFATIGHRFGCCSQHAIEGSFWMLDPLEGENQVGRTGANTLATPIDLGDVTIGPNPATFYFDDAQTHRITRHDEIYNVEVNYYYDLLPAAYNRAFSAQLLMGVRYFRFDENLVFSSVINGSTFGANGGADEAHLGIRAENNLVGFQIGTRLNYYLTQDLSFFATPKFGIYGNDIQQRVSLASGDGFNGVAAPVGGPVGGFPFESSKRDVSVLAELDLGVNWQLTQRWSVFGGYRLVAVSGLALSDEQIPAFLVDYPAINDIDSNGHLLLHGGFAGVQYAY
ncbi:MAG: BBP7 family outer membrane beta-barrel protein [Planctomycetia bacterium]|nr:BBP7 family outer membrane beta-barrel protein [Planctomycetia bacterium]